MIRRVVPIAAFVACACVYAWAAERATFIMTDGARKSGTLVAHGGQRNNIIDNQLNLEVSPGHEESYPEDRVAVIDFEGGAQPSPNELQALPSDSSTNVLVLKNGYSQPGHLVNIVNGETVIWQNTAGQQQQYGARDVSRIYLNPQSARMAYGYTGQSPQPAAVGTSGQATVGTFQLQGNVPWIDTGIMVTRGERLSFNVSGQIEVAPGVSGGPGGTAAVHGNYPVPSAPAGAVIGRVGNSAPFLVGSNTSITMPTNGRLLLGINDDYLGDNSGSFTVSINKQ